MDKSQALNILSKRDLITGEGKYRVKVTNCGDFSKELGNGQRVVAIANFSAHTPYQVEQAKGDLGEDKIADALNHNLNLSIREQDFRPAKGEIVDIIVEYVPTKSGEQALLVTSCSPIASSKATAKADFSEFAEEGAEASATSGEESMD
jgi:hypothetical protein